MNQLTSLCRELFDLIIIGDPFCRINNDNPTCSGEMLTAALNIVTSCREKSIISLPIAPLNREIPFIDLMLNMLEKENIGGVEVHSHSMAFKVHREFPRLPIYFGSFANIFTKYCSDEMENLGSAGGCLPVEMDGEEQAEIIRATSLNIYLPIFGQYPIAFSQSCFFHSDINEYPLKCSHRCNEKIVADFGDELKVIQKGRVIYSLRTLNLVGYLSDLLRMGFRNFRIEGFLMEPEEINRAGKMIRQALESYFDIGKQDFKETADRLKEMAPDGFCNGFFFGGKGMEYVEPPGRDGEDI